MNALYELADILKANGYVAASEGFEEQPAVMKGRAPCWPRAWATAASMPERRSGSTPCQPAHRWDSCLL